MDRAALEDLLANKQGFFLRYYIAVVEEHPEGIKTPAVKAKIRRRVIAEAGFDPFDEELVGGIQRGPFARSSGRTT